MTGIYAITNLNDGRATAYVGSTVCFKRRWRQHKSLLRHNIHPNSYLQAAWNKYGEHSFWFSILEVVDKHDVIVEREQYWLNEYRVTGKVYNLGTVVKNPRLGCTASEETKQKLSEARRKRPPHSKETRQRMSEAMMGKKFGPHSEETRRKISRALKGRIFPGVDRRGQTAANKRQAGTYPAFRHRLTGEIIPAGRNLSELCQERGLKRRNMWAMMRGRRKSCEGWELL